MYSKDNEEKYNADERFTKTLKSRVYKYMNVKKCIY